MPSLRLPLLAPDAVARLKLPAPLYAFALGAAFISLGVGCIYWPAGLITLGVFLLVWAVTP